MEKRVERVGGLLTILQQDRRGRRLRTVFANYLPVARFNIDNQAERRLAAIQLVELGVCSKNNAGKICGFHRNTVFKLLRTKELLGIDALFGDQRGLKEPYKYVNGIRSHIKKLLKTKPDCSDQAIADQAAKDLSMAISRSAVARIRTEKEDRRSATKQPDGKDLIELAKIAEAFEDEISESSQLELNFKRDEELRHKTGEFSTEPAPRTEKQTEQAFLERLQNGERNPFAGGLMHHLFLQEIGFADILASFPIWTGSTYQGRDVLGALFHSVLQNIQSIEALKLVNASAFGLLLGRARSPDKDTVRGHLGKMADCNLSGNLMDEFARHLLEHDRIVREVFFVDGHFLPYFGLSLIAKGYHTVRKQVMRGNETYVVSDLQGRPLFFISESNEIDFRPIILRCVEKLLELELCRPMMVFDRGGYGVHFFQTLSKKADFTTWAKHVGKKALSAIADDAFRSGLVVNGKKYLVAETWRTVQESASTARKGGRTETTKMELRLVVIQNIATGKRVGIYTNNTTRHASDIAYFMLQRWGNSENLFKELMDKFYLNYHPGYDIQELEKQPLVDNPDIAIMKRSIKAIKNELKELLRDKELLEARLAKKQDKRNIQKLANLEKAIERSEADTVGLQGKLAELPDKVSILEVLKGRPMSRCDLEKKKLYDVMQFMAYHSRERLVEIFGECYFDKRDIKPVLDTITTSPGYVKLYGKTLVVLLDWIENSKHREAAERLCCLLNTKNIQLSSSLDIKLFFRVSRVPHYDILKRSTDTSDTLM